MPRSCATIPSTGGSPSCSSARGAPARALPRRRRLSLPEAGHEVIVDEPGRLHEGIDDRRAHEAEAVLPERGRQRVRFLRPGRHHGHARPAIEAGGATDEGPHEAVEAAVLALNFEKGAGVAHRALDLQAIAHNAGIGEQSLDALAVETRD